ncbi:hypothetical protein SSS_06097 [Sarcoptes scabiei]|nr:hypothetical protein SSS_06097 [Sarcoptes scabiei]
MGVCHGDDIILMFGFPIKLEGLVFTKEETQLSEDMITAWVKFAKTGSPGKMGSIEWSGAYNGTGTAINHMNLGLPKTYGMIHDYYHENCDKFWRKRIFK